MVLENLVPSIDFSFSFNTTHWCDYNEKFHQDNDSIVVYFKKRSIEYRKFCIDILYNFFSFRSNELNNGGIFICTLFIESNSISPELISINIFFIKMKTVWKQMSKENIIDFQCVNKMTLNWNIYKEDEIKEVT
ncbi:hypothetical protein ACTFIR_011586 [Dictyostelium discoideum]